MSLIALASAKGAPGVSTLAVALAALLGDGREPLLADLDPHGGDVALRYRTPEGGPLDPGIGLLSLAASLRGGSAADPVDDPLTAHCQRIAGGLPVLVGLGGPDQAAGLTAIWPQLATVLATSDRPVVADLGRLGPDRSTLPVLRAADAVLLVARAELEQLAHLRERIHRLVAGAAPELGAGATRRVGVILVSGAGDRDAAHRTEQLLRSGGLAVPVLGTIADDPRGAVRLATGRRAGRTTLVRSVRTLLPAVRSLLGSELRADALR